MQLPCAVTRWTILAVGLIVSLAHAHTIITYPGYRGNNLHTNGTVEDTNGLSQAWVNGSYVWPYGMEWAYPCTNPDYHHIITFMLSVLKYAL